MTEFELIDSGRTFLGVILVTAVQERLRLRLLLGKKSVKVVFAEQVLFRIAVEDLDFY
jgi:hypothetical protein